MKQNGFTLLLKNMSDARLAGIAGTGFRGARPDPPAGKSSVASTRVPAWSMAKWSKFANCAASAFALNQFE
jgi:hypothetical protein